LCISGLFFLPFSHDKYASTLARRTNTEATRDNVRQAYEFALNHVGNDKDSGEIWSDYIQFLKAGEVRFIFFAQIPR